MAAKSVVFSLVLQRLSTTCVVCHCFLKENSRTTRGQPRHGLGGAAAAGELFPRDRPSTRIETPLARPRSFASPRPLACANETKRFPGWRFHKGLTPQPPIHSCEYMSLRASMCIHMYMRVYMYIYSYVYIYTYIYICIHVCLYVFIQCRDMPFNMGTKQKIRFLLNIIARLATG